MQELRYGGTVCRGHADEDHGVRAVATGCEAQRPRQLRGVVGAVSQDRDLEPPGERAGAGHPWADLKFEMTDDGFRFQYDYTGVAGGYTAHAIADLDCDGGGKTTITSTGTSSSGSPKTSHATTGDD